MFPPSHVMAGPSLQIIQSNFLANSLPLSSLQKQKPGSRGILTVEGQENGKLKQCGFVSTERE